MKPLRLSNPSAADELKAGMEWSEMTRSQGPPSSAASISCGVSTRSQVGSYPPLRNVLSRSKASSSESSTNKTLRSTPIQAPALRLWHARCRSGRHRVLVFVCVTPITSSPYSIAAGARKQPGTPGENSVKSLIWGIYGCYPRGYHSGGRIFAYRRGGRPGPEGGGRKKNPNPRGGKKKTPP